MRAILPLFVAACLALVSPSLRTQEVLSFREKTFNFGTVVNWQNPPAVFVFTNETLKGQYLMNAVHSKRVAVEMPRTRIEPGETFEIHVYFYTDKPGSFNEDILFSVSGSKDPVKLQIKGNIKSLGANAILNPPGNSRQRFDRPETIVKGRVIDSLTSKPLISARVDFQGLGAVYTNARGEFSLNAPLGRYPARAGANGYETASRMESVGRQTDEIVFKLLRNGDTPDLQADLPDENPEFSIKSYRFSNLVFLVDISGSMRREGRFELMQEAMTALIQMVRSVDALSLITFSSTIQEVFLQRSGADKTEMQAKVSALKPGGSTNSLAGLEGAFMVAQTHYIQDGNNQVILITDGVFTLKAAFLDMVKAYREQGINLSVIGFGKEGSGLNNLKRLAEIGGGGFARFAAGENVKEAIQGLIKQNAQRISE
jgi:Mg-chelatase subunit ChlD